jgi:N-acetylmuramic acid 6-phosphate (MurNAc-6-P) etherase
MLKTEMRNPLTMNFDKMSTAEMVAVMTAENANAVRAVEAASE